MGVENEVGVEVGGNPVYQYPSICKTEESVEPLKKLVEIEQAEEGYQYLGEVYYTLGANLMNDFKFNSNPQDSIKAMITTTNQLLHLKRD